MLIHMESSTQTDCQVKPTPSSPSDDNKSQMLENCSETESSESFSTPKTPTGVIKKEILSTFMMNAPHDFEENGDNLTNNFIDHKNQLNNDIINCETESVCTKNTRTDKFSTSYYAITSRPKLSSFQINSKIVNTETDENEESVVKLSNVGNFIPSCAPAPFSHEPEAISINANCDYTIRISLEMAKSGKAPRAVRVYADGAYDMFHSGHARQLMQAKCAFPNTYLIVGVSNDSDVHQYKGRTVMNEKERYEAVRHCRYVDEVVCDAPWSITDQFLQKHKIDFVAHDDIPYASPDSEDVYKPIKDAGMFLVTQRTEGISTTDVIGRIVRDYDIYLRRNIRRGLSRKDLNISYMKEKSLKLQDNLETMMKRGSTIIQNFDNKRREFVDQLEDISHEVVRSFMRVFGSDGQLRHWLTGRKRILPNSTYSTPQTSPTTSGSEDEYGSYETKRKKYLRSRLIHVSGSSSPFSDYEEHMSDSNIQSSNLISSNLPLEKEKKPIKLSSQRKTRRNSSIYSNRNNDDDNNSTIEVKRMNESQHRRNTYSN